MKAEVISIGDELTSGQRLDTNSQWLSGQLGELGIRVLYHTTVGDDIDANTQVFQIASKRADLVIATGGLGPTADDLTREAMAAAFGLELVQDDASLEHIRSLFAQRKREMPERNVVQALFPAGAQPVHNPHGSAPGIDLTVKHEERTCRMFALPGVPAEMREMYEATLQPAIAEMIGVKQIIRHYRIKCFGIGESDLEARLPDLIRRGRKPTVGITVSHATITLRITAEGPNEETCFESMQSTIQTIHECLGELVFGTEDDELQHSILTTLGNNEQTLAVAECGTKGLVGHWLSGVESPAFAGGWTITSMPDDVDVDAKHLVESMAEEVRKHFDADIGLSVGPTPESTPGGPGKIWFGLAMDGQRTISVSTPYAGHPDILQTRAAKQAMNLVRLQLLKQSEGS